MTALPSHRESPPLVGRPTTFTTGECMICKAKFSNTVRQCGYTACTICGEAGRAHSTCLQDRIVMVGSNKCPICSSPMLIDSNNTSIFNTFQSLKWYISTKNRCTLSFLLVLLSYIVVVGIHILFRAIMVASNRHVVNNSNGSCYIQGSPIKAYLFCYTVLGFVGFDVLWSFILWIFVVMIAIIGVLLFNLYRAGDDYLENVEGDPYHKLVDIVTSDKGKSYEPNSEDILLVTMEENKPVSRNHLNPNSIAGKIITALAKGPGKNGWHIDNDTFKEPLPKKDDTTPDGSTNSSETQLSKIEHQSASSSSSKTEEDDDEETSAFQL